MCLIKFEKHKYRLCKKKSKTAKYILFLKSKGRLLLHSSDMDRNGWHQKMWEGIFNMCVTPAYSNEQFLDSFGQRGKSDKVFIYFYYYYDWNVGEARHDKILVDKRKSLRLPVQKTF